jgi:uncharacterized Fe-S center protein
MSSVYFTKDLTQAEKLFDAAGFGKIIRPGDPVALKIHFGEPGNTAYLKPERVQGILEKITALGGKPFFTDCNTLYRGPRDNAKAHLKVARDHGFDPVIIPEENDEKSVEINQKHFNRVYLGSVALRASVLIVLTHFKGHEVTGFGGTLKNLGMGLASRRGKLKQHQDCENCSKIATCQKNQRIESCWLAPPALVQEKMVEYAFGAVKNKAGKAGYINFITDVSPNCDCFSHNDPPIVPDLGVLASFDPVAIDQACVDLVNQSEGRILSRNKFRALYPNVDWEIQLQYAEEIGLGGRKYDLVIK